MNRIMDEEANCTSLVEVQKENETNENPFGDTLTTDKWSKTQSRNDF